MGNEDYANEYVDHIIKSKADGILFHIREESFYKKKKYSNLILSDEFYYNIKKKINKKKIKLGISIADPKKIDFCEDLGVDFYKIFSTDLFEKKLIKKVQATKKKVFVSTGISNYLDLKKFLSVHGKKQITLIHTQLTNDLEKVNLRAIEVLKNKFQIPVAYGNHCSNLKSVYLSLAFSPSDVFFYIKGNRKKIHIDETHAVSLDALNEFVMNIQKLPKALGTGNKTKMKPEV